MTSSGAPAKVRCAIYTRVSTDQGLDQDFNSLDAQYEAASAYIKSQAHAGWTLVRSRYDDGGYSGGSTDRPNLQQLQFPIFLLSLTADQNSSFRGAWRERQMRGAMKWLVASPRASLDQGNTPTLRTSLSR